MSMPSGCSDVKHHNMSWQHTHHISPPRRHVAMHHTLPHSPADYACGNVKAALMPAGTELQTCTHATDRQTRPGMLKIMQHAAVHSHGQHADLGSAPNWRASSLRRNCRAVSFSSRRLLLRRSCSSCKHFAFTSWTHTHTHSQPVQPAQWL